MNKYNITVTDPTFKSAFSDFCEENKDACVEFLQGKMDYIPCTVDRTPQFDSLLHTRRIFLQSQLKQEFEVEFPIQEYSKDRAFLMDKFIRNKVSTLAENQTIEEVTQYQFDNKKLSADIKSEELKIDNTTIPIDKNLKLSDIPLDQIDLGFKEKPSSGPTSIDPSNLNFDNTTPVATSKNFDGLKLDGSSLAMKDKPSPQPVNIDSDMKFNNNVEIENKSLLESIKSSISKFLNKKPDALDLKNNTNKPK